MTKEDLEFYRNEPLKGSDIEDLVDEVEHLQTIFDRKAKELKASQDDIQTQKANLLSQGRLLIKTREECDQLKAEVKKKKNRIGILNRSLRRLKKGGE